MIFASQAFIFCFLPTFFILYYLAGKLFGLKGKNTVIFLMSLIFYAWGETIYVFLMLYSSLLDYTCGLNIYAADQAGNKFKKKLFLIISVCGNLIPLGVFKYLGFFTETVNDLFGLSLPVAHLALPIGISFYTFQTLSYSIDVYRGKLKPQKNFIYFGAFVTMFPQLIAGPVVRYADIAKELDDRTETLDGFVSGSRRFICGLAKKVLIANTMAEVADSLFANPPEALGALGSWVAILAYTFQIFFDFSGYSDMAIGMGKMMGFTYPENFNYPYISKSVTEFWRRWHITMSTFFRDYVYIPLGGNRCSTVKWLRNVLVVWFLTGLWHGAAWHYVAWGLYFAVLLIIEKFFLNKILSKVPVIAHIYSLFMIVFGWVIFRCDTLGQVGKFFVSLFGFNGVFGTELIPAPTLLQRASVNTIFIIAFVFAIIFSTPIVPYLKAKYDAYQGSKALKETIAWSVDIALVLLLVLSSVQLALGAYNPFIYFEF